ncbi:hypothetical protein E2C01_093549 [Portunus trituberculatus]|uniref:Uncharacterized protein n=1 Tax=Portunus trituberculatus TaxID=210409 RepID=A0A5B7JUQ1_PORTR|nr:hypothetical protein [Portunus trituberculatus]
MMSSFSDNAEAVVALLLAYRKSQKKRKCLWMRRCQNVFFSFTNSNIMGGSRGRLFGLKPRMFSHEPQI